MKKQSLTVSQERKMKFAEAGILITLVLALAIFVGVRLTSPSDETVLNGDESTSVIVETTVDSTALTGSLDQSPPTAPVIEAEPEQETVVQVSVPKDPVTYAAAEQTFFAGSFEEAATLFSSYTDAHEGNAWGFYMLGLSEWKAGDPEAAEDAFLHALELKPDHLKSLVNYSRVLIDLDRNEEAETQIALALAVNPASVDAIRVQGRIQHNLARLEEAATSYRAVLAEQGDDVWALNNLGLILIQQEKFEDALAPLAKASFIRDDVACIQNNLGIALERSGHFLAAGEAFARALVADESHAKASESLARVQGLAAGETVDPVDLAALAAGFPVAALEVDMEVASAHEVSTPVSDEPTMEGSRNR